MRGAIAWAVLSLLVLPGCVSPAHRIAALARQHHFEEDTVEGTVFRHRLYRHGGENGARSEVLHIYIEGDGAPFIHNTTIATDPTPHAPLMLRLMALDRAPSVYVGRPCYFGLYHDGPCTPLYWTLRRFSPEVVDSLAAVVISEAARQGAKSITLFGHSGGGTLAVLLSARIPHLARIVTMGANLDINAWCALHKYTPLTGSLNPVAMRLPPQSITTLHLVGSKDVNTPPSMVRDAITAGAGGSVRVINGFSHNCCWEHIWSGVLREAP